MESMHSSCGSANSLSTGKYVPRPRKVVPSPEQPFTPSGRISTSGQQVEGTALGRDDEEFAAFAQASYAGLRHAGYLLTGDGHAAEDAAQAALVRTYAAWSRVRRDDAFAYARRVLVNYLTDRWRRRLREYPTGNLPEPTASPDPADEVALRHWLIGALAALTVRERAVVVMRYVFDLPEAAVARDLGISVGTVKSTSSRALAKLRVSVDVASPAVPAPATGGEGHD
jgi:RNA polymerase sigma-70 factor (sigma-E family)